MDPNLEKILKLPTKQKAALLGLILVAIVAAFFFVLLQPKMKELKELQTKLEGLHSQVQETRKVANNLPKYKAEFERLQKELDSALTELPNQKEIPSLLTSITSAGKGAGLDFLVFRPKPDQPKDFYAEVPVDIVVSGPFVGVANFFVAVGNLSRIVNINNVSFSDIKSERGRTTTKVTCQAVTFRFLDKKEIKDDKKGKN
jgi:type IV pilus assembly protein PilO